MRGVDVLHQREVAGGVMTLLSARPGSLPADTADLREALGREAKIQDVRALLEKARQHPHVVASIPNGGYVVNTGGSAIALSAATAKTVMYVNSGANVDCCLSEFAIGFDGVTASAVPALVELTQGTKGSNSTPGTGSTSFTPLQVRGWPVKTAASTAANTCTSEPTVQTSVKQWLLTPNGGLLVMQYPLGKEPSGHNISSTAGLQIALRLTAPASVNCRGYMEWDE